MGKENSEQRPEGLKTKVEGALAAGLKAGEIGGVVAIVDGLLRGGLVQLEVGVGVTLATIAADKAKDVLKTRKKSNKKRRSGEVG